MPSMKNTLLSLATVTAVASTGSNLYATADLTTTSAVYDGMCVHILFMLGEIQTYVNDLKNGELYTQFAKAKNEIQNLADKGTLTPQQYSCIMKSFYTIADANRNFSGIVAKNLDQATMTTEKLIWRAPTYWWDFYSDILSTAATSVNNKEITSLYTAMDAKVEADIKNNASASTIIDKYSRFLISADALVPTYSKEMGDLWNKSWTSIFSDFKLKAVCSNSTTPSPTATKSPTVTPSPTADKSSSSETTSPPSETILVFETPEPTVAKAIATTTAPPVKSGASKTVSTVVSAMLVIAVCAASSLI